MPRVVRGARARRLHAVDRQPGRSARATVSAPTACEPPPTLTTIASRSGALASISSVSVAAPAMTSASFVEWIDRQAALAHQPLGDPTDSS